MSGILYGIGVGPGDPELLTLKAVRLIRGADVVLAPGDDCRQSVAWQIAAGAVPELADKDCRGVPVPMVRDAETRQAAHRQTAEFIIGLLKEEKRVAFLNLGDVTVYASFLYVHRLVLAAGYRSELVNGVTSFTAAAARLGLGLAEDEEELHLIPQPEQVAEGLKLPGTKVIMKMGKRLPEARRLILESGQDCVMVERCGMPGERVFRSAQEIDEGAGYYSLLIVKEQKPSGDPLP